jgi:hypothetical protein
MGDTMLASKNSSKKLMVNYIDENYFVWLLPRLVDRFP